MAEQEQGLREWIAEDIVQERGLNFWNGIPKEIYRQADTLIAEVNQRLEKSALTPEQIHVLSNCAEVCNDGCCGCNYACSIAAAQLKASMEVVK